MSAAEEVLSLCDVGMCKNSNIGLHLFKMNIYITVNVKAVQNRLIC